MSTPVPTPALPILTRKRLCGRTSEVRPGVSSFWMLPKTDNVDELGQNKQMLHG